MHKFNKNTEKKFKNQFKNELKLQNVALRNWLLDNLVFCFIESICVQELENYCFKVEIEQTMQQHSATDKILETVHN